MKQYFVKLKCGTFKVCEYQNKKDCKKSENKNHTISYVRKATDLEIDLYNRIKDSQTLTG